MASKLGFLIGRTRLLAVEEAVSLVERLTKGPTVVSVTEDIGGDRYFAKMPGIRHMRFGGDGSRRYAATLGFQPLTLTASPVDETLLTGLITESPDELYYRVNILKSDKKLRGGYNAFWDGGGSRLSISHGPNPSVSVSLDVENELLRANWRDLLDRAGLDERKVRLSGSGAGAVVAEFDESVPFESRLTDGPTMNQLLVETPAFSRDNPQTRKGELTGLSLFGRVSSGDPKSGELWQQTRQIWAAWREMLPGKLEFWDITFDLPLDCWEPCREWINRNLPGPFVGRMKGGTATADVTGILRNECEVGQYVELCWKRVRGRITIIAGIRETGGWRIQLSGVDELNEAKAAATREAFLKLADRDDLFEGIAPSP
jgi:hypothetical protein